GLVHKIFTSYVGAFSTTKSSTSCQPCWRPGTPGQIPISISAIRIHCLLATWLLHLRSGPNFITILLLSKAPKFHTGTSLNPTLLSGVCFWKSQPQCLYPSPPASVHPMVFHPSSA